MKITLEDAQKFFEEIQRTQNFNQLTPAQTERLAILSEEMAEAQHVIGKILRHGYASRNPTNLWAGDNKMLLQDELGHVMYAVSMLTEAGDVAQCAIDAQAGHKSISIKQYLHHQEKKD